jgi:hypothetical protein
MIPVGTIQAPAGINQAAYMTKLNGMCETAVTAMNKMFADETTFNNTREQRKEKLPEGTRLAVFTGSVDGKEVTGMIRPQYLYEKAVIKDVDARIAKFSPEKKVVFGHTFLVTVAHIQTMGTLFRGCLLACDPKIKEQGLLGSQLLKSAVYHVVDRTFSK